MASWTDVGTVAGAAALIWQAYNAYRNTTITQDAAKDKVRLDKDTLALTGLEKLTERYLEEIERKDAEHQADRQRWLQETERLKQAHTQAMAQRNQELDDLRSQVAKHEWTIEQQRQQIQALQEARR